MYTRLQPYEEMPEKTRRIFSLVAGEVIRMERAYLVLTELAMPTEPKRKLIEKSGRKLFEDVTKAYHDLFPTNLFKLVDKARDGEDFNMTLKGIIKAIEDETEKDVSTLTGMLEGVKNALKPLSIHRMKRTGHFSLSFAEEIGRGNGPALGLKEYRVALDEIERFLGAVRALFIEGGMLWEIRPMHFVGTLMAQLAKAEEYDRLVLAGKISPSLWQRHLEEDNTNK